VGVGDVRIRRPGHDPHADEASSMTTPRSAGAVATLRARGRWCS
jgi:hypothetical protein